jgi:hypothetical protein
LNFALYVYNVAVVVVVVIIVIAIVEALLIDGLHTVCKKILAY